MTCTAWPVEYSDKDMTVIIGVVGSYHARSTMLIWEDSYKCDTMTSIGLVY